VNDNFLSNNQNYNQLDDDQPVNSHGMFNGNRDATDDQDQAEEYFDDAGDIGYLPADHVSPLSH